MRLPFALKGVDVVLYTVFRSLGLKVKIRPVLVLEGDEEEEVTLVGTGLHCVKLSERGGYGEERQAEVLHPDPCKCFVMPCSPYW